MLDQLQQRGDVLLKRLDKVAGDLDSMLSEDMRRQLLAAAASLQHAADGVTTLTQQVGPATAKLPETLNGLDRTLASTNQLIGALSRPDGPLIANLNKVGTAAQQAGDSLVSVDSTLQELSARVGYETLPRVNSMADEVRVAARAVSRAGDTLSDTPSSLLFGAPPEAPGPGEPGFNWPTARTGP